MTRYEKIINARYYRIENNIIDNNEFRDYYVENFDFNTKEGIKNWLDKHKVVIYTINNDLTVDVNESVYLFQSSLENIPIEFNKVSENFYCYDNKLESLKNVPKYIGGEFNCYDNELKSLEGHPEYVGGDFDCKSNLDLTHDYLKDFNFSFVKGRVITDYSDINRFWNNKI